MASVRPVARDEQEATRRPGNRPHTGPGVGPDSGDLDAADTGEAFSEQDPQRRLGGNGTAGEHPRQQPGALNDGGSASRKG